MDRHTRVTWKLQQLMCFNQEQSILNPSPLYVQDKLKYKEQVTEGFEHMFDAFLGLFTGENTGKAVVKA